MSPDEMTSPHRLVPGMDPEDRRAAAAAALEEFCTSEAVEAWVKTRRFMWRFSMRNQLLLALQAHDRGVTLTQVQAKWRWKRAGYGPRYDGLAEEWKGAFYVWVFKSRRRKDRSWTCCGQRLMTDRCPTCARPDHWFSVGPEYDTAQVFSFEDGTPPPPAPAVEPIDGDSHEPLIARLSDWALTELEDVDRIEFDPELAPDHGGFFNRGAKLICVNKNRSPNEQFATLVHECCHAMGVDYEKYSRGDAELIVESAAMLACASLGLDTGAQALGYVAGWGGAEGQSPAQALHTHLAVIDGLARRIEKALIDTDTTPQEATAA